MTERVVRSANPRYATPKVCSVHAFRFNRSCGATVCDDCGWHEGFVSCYCGWSASGGDGYAELVGMGEQIEGDY